MLKFLLIIGFAIPRSTKPNFLYISTFEFKSKESDNNFSGNIVIPKPASAALIRANELTLSQTGSAFKLASARGWFENFPLARHLPKMQYYFTDCRTRDIIGETGGSLS